MAEIGVVGLEAPAGRGLVCACSQSMARAPSLPTRHFPVTLFVFPFCGTFRHLSSLLSVPSSAVTTDQSQLQLSTNIEESHNNCWKDTR